MPQQRGAGLLSVIIETKNHAEALARTLASLVPAAVEGFVRDVTVRDLGSEDETRKVCDHAGARWMESGELSEIIKTARCDWLLFLTPGARLLDGWIEPASAHIRKMTSPARFARSRAHKLGLFTRLKGGLDPLSEGLLIQRRQALALARENMTAQGLARGLASKRIIGEIAPTGGR
jgi:glycosyltransferase involved in cell wall biosynthesis